MGDVNSHIICRFSGKWCVLILSVSIVNVMSKRTLCFNWCSLPGARKKKRKLYFEEEENGMFVCPVPACLHEGYKSKRGLRKHVNNLHEWYLYFDTQPPVKREDAQPREPCRRKASTHKYPGFSLDNGCGAQFAGWLPTPCGGGKSSKDAKQIATRAMKYLMFCTGDSEDGLCAPESYIDCCLGSPTMLMKFLQVVTEEWGLKAAGALSYLQAITDLLDYRKCQGVPDATLRLFAVMEVYLRRSKTTLYRKRNLEYSRDLSLEALIAQGSWATLEEIEKVIPHHSPRYQQLFKQAGDPNSMNLTISELAFATRFIITFLLLRVKCTRPMSLRFLTMAMIDTAIANGGFVDQSQFKTSDKFVFDTLKFSQPSLDIVHGYRSRIRPLCNPKCDYVILTTSGTQYTSFCNAMSMLTFDAIGKHITPTRYRAIIETASIEQLDTGKQAVISKDQKHSSYVARRFYQKKLSRAVATEGAEAMKELVGDERDVHTDVLADSLRPSDTESTETMDNDDAGESQQTADTTAEIVVPPTAATSTLPAELGAATVPITIDDANPEGESSEPDVAIPKVVLSDDIEVKKEELRSGKRFLTFSKEEDKHLRAGFEKYAKSTKKWSDILNSKEYQFQEGRTRDSLRVRATSLGLDKAKKKGKTKSK